MQLCVSHQAILSKMDEMAAGFELRIQQWQDCIVKELLRKCTTCMLILCALHGYVSCKCRWWW